MASVLMPFQHYAYGNDIGVTKPHDHGHDQDAPMEELFVTSSPHGKLPLDVLQGSSVIGLDKLEQKMEATIGETLSGIPGISSTFFGAGASRPIIRGLGGDRIRILMNGIGSIDASSTSPDHAVSAEPLTAERIEVLRGASTLLYGSNAVGGVVNIIDSRIPTIVPNDIFSIRTRLAYETVAHDTSGGLSLNTRLSKSQTNALVLHMDGYFRNSNNYDIPSYALSDAIRNGQEGSFGTVKNSDVDNKGGAVGLSFIGDTTLFGLSYGITKSNYGVPSEEDVRINLDQKRLDLKANINEEFLIFEEARFRFGYGDYKHKELEGANIGTIFANKGFEARLELIQKEIGILHGSMGIQLRNREFEAIGDEAFVPPTKTLQEGIFAVEEINLDPVTLEFGARFDHQSTENKSQNIKRNFNNISLSSGIAYHMTSDSLIGLSLSRTTRAPTAEELFSNGPHLATGAFEKGNIDLNKETATNLELTLKEHIDNLTANLNLYHTWYNNFIYEHFTGIEQDGLNLLEFRQRDARFYGAELETNYLVFSQNDHSLLLTLSGDFVHAEFTGNNGYLPRIPAKSANVGFEYDSEYYGMSGDIRLVGQQKNIGANEIITKGYTEINLDVFWRPYGENQDLTIRLQGKNLTDAERRQHTSFLKDLLPMPGRNIKLSLTYGF
ncbi:MAG: TonB-dependent receptor [Emcibacter sp.]|nr:TonB-dependent receptor [Emcibacter sp.]